MIRVIKSVYKKNRIIALRAYPMSFMISRVIGGMFGLILPFVLYYIVFNKQLAVDIQESLNGISYITYIVTGEILSILSFSTLMSVGRCLITEIREGTLDTFLLSPASRLGYYVGAYLEQFWRSILESLAVLVFGLIFGARIRLEKVPILILVIVFSSISFFSLAMLVSSIMVYTRDTYLVQNTFYMLMHFICGVVFPLEFLPYPIRVLSNLFPLTPAIKLIRLSLLERSLLGNEAVMLILQIIILSVIYAIGGYYTFRRMETKLIEDVLA